MNRTIEQLDQTASLIASEHAGRKIHASRIILDAMGSGSLYNLTVRYPVKDKGIATCDTFLSVSQHELDLLRSGGYIFNW